MFLMLSVISAFSRLIPALVALVKYRMAPPCYRFFIIMIWLGTFNEILSLVLVNKGIHTTINNNIYVLAEAILIMLFFYQLAVIKKKTLLAGLIVVLVAGWLLETFQFRTIHQISSYFRIGYSFLTVMLSISCISRFPTASSIKKINTTFLICTGFIFYYTFKILVESFWTYGANLSRSFLEYIFNIMVIANFVTNLIYALAIYRLQGQAAFRQLQTNEK